MTFDASQVHDLAKVFAEAAGGAVRDFEPVVKKGAQNIKTDAAKRVSGLKHARAYPRAISYDTFIGLKGPSADIGPDKNRRQGPLGNILEFGTVNNPPHPHMRPAGDAEQPKFEQAVLDIAQRAVEGR